jgi:hypothetical protein
MNIRIWNECVVVANISVTPDGSGMSVGSVAGGAGNGMRPDIEIDPWAGLVVDHSEHSTGPTPIGWRDHQDCTPNRDLVDNDG